MVRVHIERSVPGREVRSFTMEGHADFAEAGKDIVCAGASAIAVGTVNAIEALLGVGLEARMRSGYLAAEVPETGDPARNKDVQLLLEAMVVMLRTIEQSYGKHIRIQDHMK